LKKIIIIIINYKLKKKKTGGEQPRIRIFKKHILGRYLYGYLLRYLYSEYIYTGTHAREAEWSGAPERGRAVEVGRHRWQGVIPPGGRDWVWRKGDTEEEEEERKKERTGKKGTGSRC
jgi:hypothetical protein